MDDRLWHRSVGHGCWCQTHDNRVPAGRGLRLNSLVQTSGKNQQTSLRARVLNRSAHERVDQFLQNDLARHCLRDLDNSNQLQVFDRCPNRARGTGYWLFRFEVRIQLVELLYLPISPPTQIAVPGLKQIHTRDFIKAPRRIEACRNLVGDRLVVSKAVCTRGADGLLVEMHSIEVA